MRRRSTVSQHTVSTPKRCVASINSASFVHSLFAQRPRPCARIEIIGCGTEGTSNSSLITNPIRCFYIMLSAGQITLVLTGAWPTVFSARYSEMPLHVPLPHPTPHHVRPLRRRPAAMASAVSVRRASDLPSMSPIRSKPESAMLPPGLDNTAGACRQHTFPVSQFSSGVMRACIIRPR